ncbi:hypothetical protein MKX70_16780 [Paenibacillus sp. FSL R7-0312]|uniref:hypothetical protein n=1 Tax=Paenibacillus sp. FSL R7-0312 TaxID=2921682 RepID=UPI0030F54565
MNTGIIEMDGEQFLIAKADKYEVISIAQKEGYKRKLELEAYKINAKGKNFVICYNESVKEIATKLELHELGAVIMLLPYMFFKRDGLLSRDGETMKMEQIATVIGRSIPQTKKIMKRLISVGIIIRGGSNKKPTYSISKEYHTMGEVIDGRMFTKLYQVESRKGLKEVTLHEAGILYRILPWFHYQNYYLCSNPDENDPEVIHHLSHQELAKLIRVDEKTAYTHMRKLIYRGFIIQIKGIGGAVNYRVNPDIMSKEKSGVLTTETESVKGMFRELARTFEREKQLKELGLHRSDQAIGRI